MEPTPGDKLAASVFALGLSLGFVRREDVVRWADRRIAEIDSPPLWLIDLSLSPNQHSLDLLGDLKRIGGGVDPVATCEAAYALLPDVSGYTFDQAARLAARLYQIASRCLDHDWTNPLLPAADAVADNFEFAREGDLHMTAEGASVAFQAFVRDHRDEAVARLLHPVRWSLSDDEAPEPVRGDAGPLVHVGLDSWVICDGNYDDFFVGQEADFALEFHPIDTLRAAATGPPRADYAGAGRYRVHARVIFSRPGVWVIDAGSFMAFREQQAPPGAVVGAWVGGEIRLGIDPYFYFEYLHDTEGMPPLSYRWRVAGIQRETTPRVETTDAQVRVRLTRDEARESFAPTRETDALRDFPGGYYVLACERRSGPDRPASA